MVAKNENIFRNNSLQCKLRNLHLKIQILRYSFLFQFLKYSPRATLVCPTPLWIRIIWTSVVLMASIRHIGHLLSIFFRMSPLPSLIYLVSTFILFSLQLTWSHLIAFVSSIFVLYFWNPWNLHVFMKTYQLLVRLIFYGFADDACHWYMDTCHHRFNNDICQVHANWNGSVCCSVQRSRQPWFVDQ